MGQQEDRGEEIEGGFVERGVPALGSINRRHDAAAILGAHRTFSGENLLDDYIEGGRTLSQIVRSVDSVARNEIGTSRANRGRAFALKQPQILSGIAQAVDVIDPQSAGHSFTDQPEDEVVRGFKDLGLLGADRGEVVDVEEAAIIDFVGGDTPEGQTKSLVIEKLLE